jgi:hypothetical protein
MAQSVHSSVVGSVTFDAVDCQSGRQTSGNLEDVGDRQRGSRVQPGDGSKSTHKVRKAIEVDRQSLLGFQLTRICFKVLTALGVASKVVSADR